MGRAFEYRRAAKEKRWATMSRIFPKVSSFPLNPSHIAIFSEFRQFLFLFCLWAEAKAALLTFQNYAQNVLDNG